MGVGRALAAVLVLLVLAGVAYYVFSGRPAQPSATPSYTVTPGGAESLGDVLAHSCGVESEESVVPWCVYIYRNLTAAVTRNGELVYVAGRDALLGPLLDPGSEYRAVVGSGVAPNGTSSTIVLSCGIRYGMYECALRHVVANETVPSLTMPFAGVNYYKLLEILTATNTTTLAGMLHTLGGVMLAEALWSRMAEYRGGDGAVKPYLEWLRLALSINSGYGYSYVFNNHYVYRAPALIRAPRDDSVVRIGRVELPFGVEVVVTAYTVENGVVVVVHGTVANATEWMELLVRFYQTTFTEGPYFVEKRRGGITVEWALWRILIPARNSFVVVGDSLVPIRSVVVLLEMPIYMYYYYSDVAQATVWDYWEAVEFAYWTLVHPAFAIAIRLANPPNTDLQQLYTEYGTEFTRGVVLLGVRQTGHLLLWLSGWFMVLEPKTGFVHHFYSWLLHWMLLQLGLNEGIYYRPYDPQHQEARKIAQNYIREIYKSHPNARRLHYMLWERGYIWSEEDEIYTVRIYHYFSGDVGIQVLDKAGREELYSESIKEEPAWVETYTALPRRHVSERNEEAYHYRPGGLY